MQRSRVDARPNIELTFDGIDGDYGHLFKKFEFKGTLNGGYTICATLNDPGFNLLPQLIDDHGYYFAMARVKPIKVTFRIKWGLSKDNDDLNTKPQIAYISSTRFHGSSADIGYIEFTAVDPATWFLNIGNGSGKCYKGRVSDVIKQVVTEYAPNIELDISDTMDSDQGRWWMMRQDPMTFINSLAEWAPAITEKKTQWMIGANGNKLSIKEQAKTQSKRKGYFTYWDEGDTDTIKSWEILANNSLSSIETKIITQGLSAVSGKYLDITTADDKIAVSDRNTQNKFTASTKWGQSFDQPSDQTGFTSVLAIPEIYSAGDIGLIYEDYIDGRARRMWLDMVNHLIYAKFTVLGHAVWSDTISLGSDTIFIKWLKATGEVPQLEKMWFTTGNWLVTGFHHKVTLKGWHTDIYASRWDFNSNSQKVGASDVSEVDV